MRKGTIHPNDCGNCIHWKPYTDKEGLCDKIPKGTVFCEEGYTYDGYSFVDECYDEDLHCFESNKEEQ